MLTNCGAAVIVWLEAAEGYGQDRDNPLAHFLVVEFDVHARFDHRWVGHYFGGVVHRSGGDSPRAQRGDQCIALELARQLAQFALQRVNVLKPRRHGVETPVNSERRRVERFAQVRKFLIGNGDDGHPLIVARGGKGAVWREVRVAIPNRVMLAPVKKEIHHGLGQHPGDHLGDRQIDILSLAGAVAIMQSAQHAQDHYYANDEIRPGAPDTAGLSARIAGQVRDARKSQAVGTIPNRI